MAVKRKVKRTSELEEISLKEAFDEFLYEKEVTNLAPSTIANYEQTYRIFCDFFNLQPEETPVNEIGLDYFYKWINTLKQEGAKVTTINHYIRDMRVFIYWCQKPERSYIEIPYKIPTIQGQEEQIKLFSDEELEMLLEHPNKNDGFTTWRSWAIVNWVLATGNRAATICDIRLTDIDYTRKEITLHHTKNKKASTIPLSTTLESSIKEYIRIWRSETDINGWLFPNIGEEQLTTNALRLSFGKYCKDRGVEHTNIHGLRHNFAKGWVRNNGNLFQLQKILGHSTLEMTRKYVRLFNEDLKEDFDVFNPLDNIKKNSRRKQTIQKSVDAPVSKKRVKRSF